jgi:hypothetical protein
LKKHNGDKIVVVVRCNKKDLEKLSLFILADDNEVSVSKAQESFLAVDDLIKLKELSDAGVITEEEFTKKKKQLLGI